MADIVTELNTIYSNWMGVDIRFPIHDAIEKINNELNAQDEGNVQEVETNG